MLSHLMVVGVFNLISKSSGNDNANADPEIIAAIRGLRKSIDVPTAPQVTIGNASDKTKYYPDGDTFTGVASSSAGDIVVYVRFNEQIDVTGTPQLQLKQATALGSNFGTIMDYNSGYSDLSNGVMAFALLLEQTQEQVQLQITHLVLIQMMQ